MALKCRRFWNDFLNTSLQRKTFDSCLNFKGGFRVHHSQQLETDCQLYTSSRTKTTNIWRCFGGSWKVQSERKGRDGSPESDHFPTTLTVLTKSCECHIDLHQARGTLTVWGEKVYRFYRWLITRICNYFFWYGRANCYIKSMSETCNSQKKRKKNLNDQFILVFELSS